jgi:hypothetical protein
MTTNDPQNPPDRIFVPGNARVIDGFRALRAWFEQHAAARGQTLDPAWYRDTPEERPELYPELRQQSSPEASTETGGPT